MTKINMPTKFVVKKYVCIGKHAHVHGNTCCTAQNLPIQVILHFFPQNVFKIYMKLVSLKMVTNMYCDLRRESTSEYLYTRVHRNTRLTCDSTRYQYISRQDSSPTSVSNTVPRQIWRNVRLRFSSLAKNMQFICTLLCSIICPSKKR